MTMAQANQGVGGVGYDASKRSWPPELNVLMALVLIVVIFEALGRLFLGESFLLNSQANATTLFNEQRLQIIILQVSIIGIIALGVTQVIISGGIDLSSGSIVGATAMIAMSFAQVAIVNGNPNPKAIFPELGWLDLPVIIPIVVGTACGVAAGLVNGAIIAYTRIPPFIATLGMMVEGKPDFISDRELCRHRQGHDAGFHFHSSRHPVPAHSELHQIRQALLRHRLKRRGLAHRRHQGRASQDARLHHRRRARVHCGNHPEFKEPHGPGRHGRHV
jgi:Branched-chain amino acid transport system / permease component